MVVPLLNDLSTSSKLFDKYFWRNIKTITQTAFKCVRIVKKFKISDVNVILAGSIEAGEMTNAKN